MHTGKELEAHQIEKGCLSCDSVAPQVGSAWSDYARVVKVNHPKMNRCKRDPTVYLICRYPKLILYLRTEIFTLLGFCVA